jgi:hypothetical protein
MRIKEFILYGLMAENCKLRKAILSAFYNILQRNFGILLILWCSFKLWWNFCLDLLSSKFWLIGDWSICVRLKYLVLVTCRVVWYVPFTSAIAVCSLRQCTSLNIFSSQFHQRSVALVWLCQTPQVSSWSFCGNSEELREGCYSRRKSSLKWINKRWSLLNL